MSPLEAAVRGQVQKRYEPLIGKNPRFDAEGIAQVVERKTQETLAILRETLSDNEVPTEDDLFHAEMETSHRTVENLIPKMRNPTTRDPWRREILNDLADDAEANLARFRALGSDVTEAQLADISQAAVERFRALTEKVRAGRPPSDPPAPQ